MSQIADHLKAAWEPWMTADLADYADAIGVMFAEVELYAFDHQDGTPGWATFLDPDLCPAPALPYLAQYVGERLPVGISEAAAREWIKDAPNQIRGTVKSVFYAAQRKLTGTRLVTLIEKPGGVVDKITVVTYTDQTPDPAGTLADLRDVVPEDVILDYTVAAGETWAGLEGSYTTWADVKAAYATWADAAADLGGSNTYSRPRP